MDKERWFTRDEAGGITPLGTQDEIDEAVTAGRPVFVITPENLFKALDSTPSLAAWEGWVEVGYTVDTPPDLSGLPFQLGAGTLYFQADSDKS